MTLLSSAINKVGNAMHFVIACRNWHIRMCDSVFGVQKKTSTAVAKPRKGITPLSVKSPVYADAVTGQSQICIGV